MEQQLARMEATQMALLHELRRFCDEQDNHNKVFYEVRDEVRDIKASTKGAWFIFGLFGTLTVTVSGLVAWVINNLKG
jgi:hypothetical protein